MCMRSVVWFRLTARGLPASKFFPRGYRPSDCRTFAVTNMVTVRFNGSREGQPALQAAGPIEEWGAHSP